MAPQAVRFARGATSAFRQRSPLLCREQSFDFGYCVARPRGLPPAKRKDRGWQVTLWVEVNARCASPPAFARCEGIHIAFSRQQEFQKAYVSDVTGLIEAQQYQMLGKAGLFNASPNILSIVANSLYGIFGQIVVPRYAVMLQEREQAFAIPE